MKILLLFPIVVFAFSALQAQCTITVSLGSDTTFCPGQGLTLAPGVYDSYLWDDGSTGITRLVSSTGTYYVTVSELGTNLITNSDFEQGDMGFTTQYMVGTGGAFGQLSDPGTYAITTSPNLVHTNFNSCADHTAAAGANQFVANGASTANTEVWCQDVVVQPGTLYQFGTWVTSVENSGNVAQLQFRINGVQVGTIFSPSASGCDWSQFTTNWSSGAVTGTIPICIINQNTAGGGNDFAMDDIAFRPICLASDTITISIQPSPTVTGPADVEACPGETITVSATANPPGSTISWPPATITGNEVNITATQAGDFYVTATYGGCVSAPDTFHLFLSTACFIEVPNVFTPNSDGSNDYFQLLSYEGIEELECTILNRWGTTIRSFSSPDFKWDGKNEEGTMVSDGVYFYIIKASMHTDKDLEQAGMVQKFE